MDSSYGLNDRNETFSSTESNPPGSRNAQAGNNAPAPQTEVPVVIRSTNEASSKSTVSEVEQRSGEIARSLGLDAGAASQTALSPQQVQQVLSRIMQIMRRGDAR